MPLLAINEQNLSLIKITWSVSTFLGPNILKLCWEFEFHPIKYLCFKQRLNTELSFSETGLESQ